MKRPTARLILLTAFLLAITACADRSACPADLRGAGEATARAGEKPDLPNDRCALDTRERELYFAGRASGLQWFCAGPRLFEEARLGRSPDLKQCPLDYADEALAAQRTGEEIRKAQETSAREHAAIAQLVGSDPRGSSEAGLRARTADGELEQLRALAITRGWLANPALSGQLPNIDSGIPDSIRKPDAAVATDLDPSQ